MKNILCYANNLVANVVRSIRYIGNYKAPLISSFDRLRISIVHGGKMKIGITASAGGSTLSAMVVHW